MISPDLFAFACLKISLWFAEETVTVAVVTLLPFASVFVSFLTSVGELVTLLSIVPVVITSVLVEEPPLPPDVFGMTVKVPGL